MTSEEDPKQDFALRMDWKDIGEPTALTSGPLQDQRSQAGDVYDFESSCKSSSFKVGSLKAHVELWSDSIQASDFIINTIVDGCRIPFFDLPERYFIPNRSSALEFKDVANEAISELIKRGCVMEVDMPPVLINHYTLYNSPVGNAGLFWICRI